MRFVILMLMFVSVIGCERKLSRSEVESELKKALTNHLYKSINYDSAKVKFIVQDVNFFEDKEVYDCEFHVHMITKTKDTTGIMVAAISKDFTNVNRKR
ncbi:MAG TPA: hypothetical protein VMH01_08155 [Puia sp.]|nr:hypothetical protein [Puia sp.]